MFNKKLLYFWLIPALLLTNTKFANAKTVNAVAPQTFPKIDRLSPAPNYIKLLVVIANPVKADTLSITNNEVKDIIFGKGNSLKTFYKKNSYGLVNITGNVVGPFEVSYPIESIEALGLDAVDPFIDARGYNRVLIISTISGTCDGYASGYGPQGFVTGEGAVNLAVAVTTGQCVKDFRDQTKNGTILHEFGHTLGLGHTAAWLPISALGCSSSIPLENVTENGNCYSTYGGSTVMGTANSDLNNVQRSMLASSFSQGSFQFPSLTITENGDYWVHWFKDNPDLVYYDELKIPAQNGYFSVEFRKNAAPVFEQEKIFINFASNIRLTSAIPVGHYMDSILVWAPAFSLQNVNDVYEDATRNFSVRVLQMEENRALLRITVD